MKLEKIGIARLKMLMGAVLQLSATIQKQLADGAQITDLFALVTAWPNITVIINEAKGAWGEFKDLDAAESADLAEYLADNFDIENNELEAKIEQGLRLAAKWHHQAEGTILLFEDTKSWLNSLKPATNE